jgi:hypothetical protein
MDTERPSAPPSSPTPPPSAHQHSPAESQGKTSNRADWLGTIVRVFNATHFYIASWYDALYTEHRRELIERFIVYLAIIGFLFHIGLIFVIDTFPMPELLENIVGTNYLTAIYTPFSFILFYELFALVLAMPESTTRAIGTQFEIISLIIIRNVFKDLASLERLTTVTRDIEPLMPLLINMAGGLLLFVLVAVFFHISRRRSTHEEIMGAETLALRLFVARKKMIALLLSGVFVVLAFTSVWEWGHLIYRAALRDREIAQTLVTIFYSDMFTVLIFTDILILIQSLLLSNSYHLVFRNAGFVVSTILIRIAISAKPPFDVGIALIAVLFGILVLLIYKYAARIYKDDHGVLGDQGEHAAHKHGYYQAVKDER